MSRARGSPADLAGRRVTVMGLGLFGGGSAAARWLAGRGARVLVTDLRDADVLAPALAELRSVDCELVLGGHSTAHFTDTDLVVANPAVPPRSPFLAAARAAGVPVTSELELFLDATRARLALVTGTQGKSSTAQFLAQLCAGWAPRVYLGGNIGTSLLDEVHGMRADDVCVVEVSSYQLEALNDAGAHPRVDVVGLTNVELDHLERHGSPEAYAAAKARVLGLVRSGGACVLPAELAAREPFAAALRPDARVLRSGPGAQLFRAAGRFRDGPRELGREADLGVPGRYQRDNALLALGLARALGAPAAHLAARVPALRGLPHRQEELAAAAGRRVIDNGVSTTPDSTIAVLDELEAPCTLLAGGQPKRGLAFDALAARVAARGDSLVAFGAAAAELAAAGAAAGAAVDVCTDLSAAVACALERTPPGGTLLFSPACASFDAYPNFRARALAFRALLPRA